MVADNLSRCREHILRAQQLVSENRQFQVGLNDRASTDGEAALETLFPAVYSKMVRPVLEQAEYCRVYNFPNVRVGADAEVLALHARLQQQHLEVDLKSRRTLEDVKFWWLLLRSFAHPVVVLDSARFEPVHLFAQAYDPVVTNALSGVTPLAQSHARKATEGGGHVALVFDRTQDQVTVSVFGAAREIARLFEAAVGQAHLSDFYLATFCTYHVRPIDMGGWTFYRNEVVEAREAYAPLLLNALKEADARPTDGKAAARALTAAELLAALAGQPPESFTHDLSTQRRIANWVAWARRETTPPSSEVIELARRVVNLIAEQRELAEQAWKTEELRDKWRETLADLGRRLASGA